MEELLEDFGTAADLKGAQKVTMTWKQFLVLFPQSMIETLKQQKAPKAEA